MHNKSMNSKLPLIVLITTVSLLTNCNVLRPGAKNSDEPQSNSSELNEDISAYATYCRQELGFVGTEIPALNCLDGVEIPALIDGKSPTAAQYALLAKSEIGCDQPSWLEGLGCINYNFVLTRKINDNVDLALICRSRNFSSADDRATRSKIYEAKKDLASFKSLYYFDSLGMIVSNNKSGKTCFFDQIDPVYGGFIPYPDRKSPPTIDELPSPKPQGELLTNKEIQENVLNVTASKTWIKPFQTARSDRCTMCHDSGPWKHSPWLPAEVNVPANNQSIPYIAIGPAFNYWRVDFEPTSISTTPVQITTADGTKTEPQLCTSCHRIGREATCRQMIDFATGHTDPGPLSATGKTAHARQWMPPPSKDLQSLSDDEFKKNWDTHFKAHYEALRKCCQNPKQDGCTQTPFGQNR